MGVAISIDDFSFTYRGREEPALKHIHAQAEEGDIMVERVLPSGYEVLKTAMPALLTISYQVGALRYPTLISVRASKNKPVTVMTLADLGLDGDKACPLTMRRLEVPDRERSVVMISGKDSQDAGAKLAIQLRQELGPLMGQG